ncbi:MAG TPA: hypothetical protein VN281_07755, partial [Verrucomicrobiae bacterium]|nr:hypothetical protein [Verrucomicrobiae bacterium]
MSEGGNANSENAMPGRASPIHESPNQRAWRRFRGNRPAVISAWFLGLLLLVVTGWPIVLKVATVCGQSGKAFALKYDPDTLSDQSFEAPTSQHWFGTDVHGRDL